MTSISIAPPTEREWTAFALQTFINKTFSPLQEDAARLVLQSLMASPQSLTARLADLETVLEVALTQSTTLQTGFHRHLAEHPHDLAAFPWTLQCRLFTSLPLKHLSQNTTDFWLTTLSNSLKTHIATGPFDTATAERFLEGVARLTLGHGTKSQVDTASILFPLLNQTPELLKLGNLKRWWALTGKDWTRLSQYAALFSAKDWVETLPEWGSAISKKDTSSILQVIHSDPEAPTYSKRMTLPFLALTSNASALAQDLIELGYPLEAPHAKFSSSLLAHLVQLEHPLDLAKDILSFVKAHLPPLNDRQWAEALKIRVSKFGKHAQIPKFVQAIHHTTSCPPPTQVLTFALMANRVDWVNALQPFSSCRLGQPVDDRGNNVWHYLLATADGTRKLNPTLFSAWETLLHKASSETDAKEVRDFLLRVRTDAKDWVEQPNSAGVLPALLSTSSRFRVVNQRLPLDKTTREFFLTALTPDLMGKNDQGETHTQSAYVLRALKSQPELSHLCEYTWLRKRTQGPSSDAEVRPAL